MVMIENKQDKKLILANWDLLSKETRSMLQLIGIAPAVQDGKKAN